MGVRDTSHTQAPSFHLGDKDMCSRPEMCLTDIPFGRDGTCVQNANLSVQGSGINWECEWCPIESRNSPGG